MIRKIRSNIWAISVVATIFLSAVGIAYPIVLLTAAGLSIINIIIWSVLGGFESYYTKKTFWKVCNYLELGFVLGIILSVICLNWPLCLTYYVSKPAFTRFASNIRNDKVVQSPATIGLFRFQKIERRDGIVCFWFASDQGDNYGFVNISSPSGHFNTFYEISLGDWSYIVED